MCACIVYCIWFHQIFKWISSRWTLSFYSWEKIFKAPSSLLLPSPLSFNPRTFHLMCLQDWEERPREFIIAVNSPWWGPSAAVKLRSSQPPSFSLQLSEGCRQPLPASLLWSFTETSDYKDSMPQTTTIFLPKPASPPILLWCNNNSPCLLNTCYVPSMVLKVPVITSSWIITTGSHKTGIIVSTLIFQVRKLRHRVATQLMGGIVRISVRAESWVLDLPILPSDQPPSSLDWWLCTQSFALQNM